jgi:hypothetical protein
MFLKLSNLKKTLSKAYYKQSIKRSDIELLKVGLQKLYHRFNETESEEHLKNLLSDFLKETWYNSRFEINTKGRIDLAIHNGKTSKDSVGVIIEAKKPQSPERMTEDCLNCKALHELILYYFDERNENKNIEVKHLISTNINEWFIFDENEFDKIFYRNTKLQKLYKSKIDQSKDNPFFYSEAQKIIAELEDDIVCAHFNLKDFEKVASNADNSDDTKLIELYKIFSPEHLLKLPFQNDSNSLNKEFYNELLHIIGLEETKEGSKKLISRKKPENRDDGSLLENTINILRIEGSLDNIPNPEQFGETEEERLFSVGLELCINWLNRILFLKLLEGQLISYHRENRDFSFLNASVIQDFDELNELFFEVLAVKTSERTKSVNKKFGNIPYLNSSLFERSELENHTIRINSLKDRLELPVYKSTVIKDNGGSRITGAKTTLHYLFAFLDAYDFASESTAKIQEQNKNIINASVLGLIFEKINGYKDGSFFTPGFITMYMCRETLRRATTQKFNEHHNWNVQEFNDLKDKIDCTDKTVRQQANNIINSLKVCDPAVGSGHFLVSALNEIIAIKSELGVLQYRDGSRIRGNKLTIENDELIIIDEETDQIFEYRLNQNSKPVTELQSLQETIFHEKQTIIENCLFGVDINPKSVMICRLRLWVELLKNAYYTKESNYTELETLPNIDINIKCGNSLISRFALDSDLKQALKKSKWNIDTYRIAVQTYRNASSKAEKREMEKLIESIKNDFESEIARNDKRFLRLVKLKGELTSLTTQTTLFEKTKKEQEDWTKQVNTLTSDIQKLETELEEIKNNAIYQNAFEWRFEFPEVLNENGDYLGFDVVIGNPPYGVKITGNLRQFYTANYQTIDDIFTIFIEKGLLLIHKKGIHSYITPVSWLTNDNYLSTRNLIAEKAHLVKGIILPYDIFEDAYVDTGVFIFDRSNNENVSFVHQFSPKDDINVNSLFTIHFTLLQKEIWTQNPVKKIIFNATANTFQNKITQHSIKLENITNSCRGILAKNESYSNTQLDDRYKPIFTGKLNRYCIEDKEFIYIKYDETLSEKPKSYDFFTNERILVRRIVSRQFRIMAHIISDEFVNKKDIYVFKSIDNEKYPNKFLIAIINSKLISYFKTQSSTSAKKDDFTQITLNDIREISIPENYQEHVNPIVSLVNQILINKDLNFQADTNELENQIDQLVYELYGLTEEEIKIVKQTK